MQFLFWGALGVAATPAANVFYLLISNEKLNKFPACIKFALQNLQTQIFTPPRSIYHLLYEYKSHFDKHL